MIENKSFDWKRFKDHPMLFSFVFSIALTAVFYLAFAPRWETIDDVFMSMVAHGYGLAAYGSPNLYWSNILWGYFVRSLPSIHGILGYSLASTVLLLIISWAFFYFLLRLGVNYLYSALAVVLVMAQPTLFPQFTITAGLLTVAALLGWQVYSRSGGAGILIGSCFLAFLGYLTRWEEFYLVMAVTLPAWPWETIRRQRSMQVALAILALAIALAAMADRATYNGQEWKAFKDMEVSRKIFTDYKTDIVLKTRPDILARYGYSDNDIDMLTFTFHLDPAIANPKKINAMLKELGPFSLPKERVKWGLEAIGALATPRLLSLFLAAVLLLVMIPRRSLDLTWVLCLASLFVQGALGRPGVLRVYVPLLSFLLMLPLTFGPVKDLFRKRIVLLTLLAACIGNACWLIPQAIIHRKVDDQIKKDAALIPSGTLFSWSHVMPFEIFSPVFFNDSALRNRTRWNAVHIFSLAPFSVCAAEEKEGRGLLKMLRSPKGIPIIARPYTANQLGLYCLEHYKGTMQVKPIMRAAKTFKAYQMRCYQAE